MNNIEKKIQDIVSIENNLKEDLLVMFKKNSKNKKNIFLGKDVDIEPNVFLDTSKGSISIGEGTKIKANSVLRGPLIIGNNCVINTFTEISCSRIGNFCKVGGEVINTIFEDYSNKQHFGFLGHSYVGSWVNIGGGTSVSNLKMTYNSIYVNDIDTKEIFFGAIFEDHSKTALNTSIFCGKILGFSSHSYGLVTDNVPAFSSHIRKGIFYELPLSLSKYIARAMMKRRNIEFSKIDDIFFDKIFKETIRDRKLVKIKKGKLNFK